MKKILICFTLLIFGVGCQPIVQTQLALQATPEIDFPTPVPETQSFQKGNVERIQPTLTISPSGLESLIEKAKGDLAKRLSIEFAEISLVEAKEVVWPDASLGCPQMGMVYAQVITPGLRIILDVTGEQYEYHTGMDNAVTLCESIPVENSSKKDKNVDDGWPNQTKDKDVIFVTPTPRK